MVDSFLILIVRLGVHLIIIYKLVIIRLNLIMTTISLSYDLKYIQMVIPKLVSGKEMKFFPGSHHDFSYRMGTLKLENLSCDVPRKVIVYDESGHWIGSTCETNI